MTENQLLFYFKTKNYPYSEPNKKHTNSVKWGELKIAIASATNRIVLLETEWDLSERIKWFKQNEKSIRYEALNNDQINLCVINSESLAQALNRLQEKDFSEEEEQQDLWFDTLFAFRESHCLRFALRGSKVPEIIIGCNNQTGEVSLSNKTDEWSYEFNLDDFFADFNKKAFDLISDTKGDCFDLEIAPKS